MIYLLDVNALVALGFVNHEFHDRVAILGPSTKLAPLGDLLDHRVGICAGTSAGSGLRIHHPSSSHVVDAPEGGERRPLYIHTRPARCFSSSNLGQSPEANYRRSPEQACQREWWNPCNFRREYPRIVSHSPATTLTIAVVGRWSSSLAHRVSCEVISAGHSKVSASCSISH